ncbi:MAG: hypothetical protein ACKVOU_03655 [Cytophagales bacterium]
MKMKGKPLESVKEVGMQTIGGLAANQASAFLEKQPMLAGFEALVPIAPFALGMAISMFLPKFKSVGLGMATVAMVEIGEIMIAKTMTMESKAVAGIPYYKNSPDERLS